MTDRLREDPKLGVFADAYPMRSAGRDAPRRSPTLIAFLLSEQASLAGRLAGLRRRRHRRPAASRAAAARITRRAAARSSSMRRTRVVLSTMALAAAVASGWCRGRAVPAPPIPPLPTDLLSESFTGTPAVKQPIAHSTIPSHPYLSANGTSSMHDDAYASDAYTVSGPLGRDLQVRSASYGISECATMGFDAQPPHRRALRRRRRASPCG